MSNKTLRSYISNPMGDGTSVFTNRAVMRDFYSRKFDAILLRENGTLNTVVYKDGNRYLVHIKIPSEKVNKFYYDTVFEFTKENITDTKVEDFRLRFFSNDPSFIYTFAYASKKNDMLIKDLYPKVGKLALEEKPKQTNPHIVMGYIKSIYFGYLYLFIKNMLKSTVLDNIAKPYNAKLFLNSIRQADIVINERQQAWHEQNKKDKIHRTIASNISKRNNLASTVSNVKNTKLSKSTKTSSKLKLTKIVKKI